MTDQQRFDTMAALGNQHIYTPNMDRLVRRGLSFTNAYSTCPVCVPARYTIRTGCEPPTMRIFTNGRDKPVHGQANTIEGRCGPYLAKTMKDLGYRTFGIGKLHSIPWNEDLGYDIHLHSEELYAAPEQRAGDAYASWLHREHPEYDHLEGLMGERTEMYYMPQMSAQPADCAVEGWAAARAVEQISNDDKAPYFGMVSFIGPHPPFAPPIPFNRMYDPDRMPSPVKGDIATDHMDQQIPWMNDIIWAEAINDPHARILKARYYGEISYIDHCLGRILDAVEAVNRDQKKVPVEKIIKHFGNDLKGKVFALWGLAFKPDTDDMRDAPSRVVMEALWERGARVKAFDPVATEEAKRIYGDRDDLELFSDNPNDALVDADCLVIVTEWRVFRASDLGKINELMNGNVIVDGRNIFSPAAVKESDMTYYGIGRK